MTQTLVSKTPESLSELTDAVRAFAALCARLADTVEEIRDDQRRVAKRKMNRLKRDVAEVSAAREAVKALLLAAPELFVKPRTRAIEGIKVGYRKQPGRVDVADEARSIALIRRKMPEREASLVRVKETLNKAAIRELDARDLAAIGVTVTAVDDEVVIAAVADDLDRLVDSLMTDIEEAA